MSSCFWHGWNVKSCSIFSNLPIVILHQQRQLKMSGSHLGVWKAFPGKPLMIQSVFELVMANPLGSEAKCMYWLIWGFAAPHSFCGACDGSQLSLGHGKPWGTGWTHTCAHMSSFPPSCLILTHCLQPPSTEVSLVAETELGHGFAYQTEPHSDLC